MLKEREWKKLQDNFAAHCTKYISSPNNPKSRICCIGLSAEMMRLSLILRGQSLTTALSPLDNGQAKLTVFYPTELQKPMLSCIDKVINAK